MEAVARVGGLLVSAIVLKEISDRVRQKNEPETGTNTTRGVHPVVGMEATAGPSQAMSTTDDGNGVNSEASFADIVARNSSNHVDSMGTQDMVLEEGIPSGLIHQNAGPTRRPVAPRPGELIRCSRGCHTTANSMEIEFVRAAHSSELHPQSGVAHLEVAIDASSPLINAELPVVTEESPRVNELLGSPSMDSNSPGQRSVARPPSPVVLRPRVVRRRVARLQAKSTTRRRIQMEESKSAAWQDVKFSDRVASLEAQYCQVFASLWLYSFLGVDNVNKFTTWQAPCVIDVMFKGFIQFILICSLAPFFTATAFYCGAVAGGIYCTFMRQSVYVGVITNGFVWAKAMLTILTATVDKVV